MFDFEGGGPKSLYMKIPLELGTDRVKNVGLDLGRGEIGDASSLKKKNWNMEDQPAKNFLAMISLNKSESSDREKMGNTSTK